MSPFLMTYVVFITVIICCSSPASLISQHVSRTADDSTLPLSAANISHRWRHGQHDDNFFMTSRRRLKRKSRHKHKKHDVTNHTVSSSQYSYEPNISQQQASRYYIDSEAVNNALSSIPKEPSNGNQQSYVDIDSNHFFDPSIKITIEVVHEKDHSEGQNEPLDVIELTAEKRERLRLMLSSIDSPLDGSHRIQGSGLFSTPTPSQRPSSTHRQSPNHSHSPSKGKNKKKHRRKKHRKPSTSMTEGSTEWGSWGACSATCGQGIRERYRKCGSLCYQTERSRCFSTCHDLDLPKFLSLPSEDTSTIPDTSKIIEPEGDNCQKWIDCEDPFLASYSSGVRALPTCPCEYPLNLRTRVSDQVYDDVHKRNFRWLDASAEKDRLEVFKKGASYCIRSRLDFGTGILGSQHCCYDANMHLLTRGSGAGTPDLVSPELSSDLHYKVDVLPWIVCKGDWTRYHEKRQPNNARGCQDNPDNKTVQSQRLKAKNY